MKLKELRRLIDPNVSVWLETLDGKYLESGEIGEMSRKFDGYIVKRQYVEHYPALFAWGLTIQIVPEADDFSGVEIQVTDDVPGAVIAPVDIPEREIDKDFNI